MFMTAIAAAIALAQQPDIDAIEREVRAMRPEKSVWREIEWDTCLLEGLARSREQGKPVLLWVFLHNPNEERC